MGAEISTEGKERERKFIEHKRRNAVLEKGDRCIYPPEIMQKTLDRDGLSHIGKFLIQTKSVIAGSYPLHAILSMEEKQDWVAGDIDIWVPYVSKKNSIHIVTQFMNKFGIYPFRTTNFNLDYERMRKYVEEIVKFRIPGSLSIQLMFINNNYSVLDAIRTFDISVCRCVYDGTNLYQLTSYPGKRDFCTKKIAYITPECVPDQKNILEWVRTMQRVIKYTKRGFRFKMWGVLDTIPDSVGETIDIHAYICWNKNAYEDDTGTMPFLRCDRNMAFIYHPGYNASQYPEKKYYVYPSRILKVFYNIDEHACKVVENYRNTKITRRNFDREYNESLGYYKNTPPLPDQAFNYIKPELSKHLKEPGLINLIGDLAGVPGYVTPEQYKHTGEIKIGSDKKLKSYTEDEIRSLYSIVFPNRQGTWGGNTIKNMNKMLADLKKERTARKKRERLARQEKRRPPKEEEEDIVRSPGEYTDDQLYNMWMDTERIGIPTSDSFGLPQPTDEELRIAQAELDERRRKKKKGV